MANQAIYEKALKALYDKALKIQQEKFPERAESHKKVACVVAVNELKDSFAKHGQKVPLDALLACRELFMEAGK